MWALHATSVPACRQRAGLRAGAVNKPLTKVGVLEDGGVAEKGAPVAVQEPDRYGGTSPVGSSAAARAFGASISVATEGQSLFLVVGRTGPPDLAVRAVGGQVLMRLPDQRRVLAVAALDVYPALNRHPEIALAGPVSIDAERFGRFAKLIGLDGASPEEREPIDDATARR